MKLYGKVKVVAGVCNWHGLREYTRETRQNMNGSMGRKGQATCFDSAQHDIPSSLFTIRYSGLWTVDHGL